MTTHERITRCGAADRDRCVWQRWLDVAPTSPTGSLTIADHDIRAWWCLPRDAEALGRTADLLGLDRSRSTT